jgi:hypothetical protein
MHAIAAAVTATAVTSVLIRRLGRIGKRSPSRINR